MVLTLTRIHWLQYRELGTDGIDLYMYTLVTVQRARNRWYRPLHIYTGYSTAHYEEMDLTFTHKNTGYSTEK